MAMDTIPTGAAPRIAVVTTDESVQLAAQEDPGVGLPHHAPGRGRTDTASAGRGFA